MISQRCGNDRGAMPREELGGAVSHGVLARAHRQALEMALQVRQQVAGRRVAPLRILPHRHQHDVVEVASQPPPQLFRRTVARDAHPRRRQRDFGAVLTCDLFYGRSTVLGLRRIRLHDRARHLVRAPGLQPVRPVPCQDLVENDAQRVNVGGGVDRLAADLLRAGVLRRQHARHGDCHLRRVHARLQHLRDAEIEQLGRAVLGDQNVAGLQVAVDDQVLVRVEQCRADLLEQRHALRRSQVIRIAIFVERLAVDQFHDEVRRPSAVVPPSKSRAMFGWLRLARIWRSRRKRSTT